MPKIKKSDHGQKFKSVRRTPLHVDILADEDIGRGVKKPNIRKTKPNDLSNDTLDDSHIDIVDSSLSMRILQLAAEQQREDDEEECEVQLEPGTQDPAVDKEGFVNFDDDYDETGAINMENFLAKPSNNGEQRTLADIILAKLKEKEDKTAGKMQGNQPTTDIDPKVTEVYTEIAKFLAKYRSGRLPKAFKIIPRLSNWEEILYITGPIDWTPNAMHEAIRIFASNLKPRMAQRFYNLVLLPAIREDILVNKKLNFHYYQALKIAFYKPSAWFQGILFPLLTDGCTLREAVIFGSILSKISIPPLHTAAALVRLCDLHKGDTYQWTAATSYVINTLLHKKCALPVTCVASVVNHFGSFEKDTRELPVIWHQSLLTMVQHYKFDFSSEQRTIIRNILRIHFHHLIGLEIRREMQHAEAMKWMAPQMEVD